MFTRILSLISLSLLIFSCEPKDQKLVRPALPSNPTSQGAADGKYDNYKYVSVLIDREVEALHLLKALTNPEYAAAHGLKFQDMILSSELIVSKIGEKTQTTQINYLVQLELNQDQSLRSVILTENSTNQMKEFLQLKMDSKSPELEITNTRKMIVIKKLEADSQYLVTVTTSDFLKMLGVSGFAENTAKFIATALKENGDFAINEMILSHFRGGVPAANFAMKTKASSLVISLNECSNLNGTLSLESVELNAKSLPLYANNFKYTNSKVEVEAGKTKATFEAGDCSTRPIVELRKLF